MNIYSTKGEIGKAVKEARDKGLKVGFVPTMGALHRGHLSLLKRAREENDLSLCSIFVNPIQFNNPHDLEKYPRNPEADHQMLEEAGCDMVFSPTVEEMYPEGEVKEHYDFGHLNEVMEGAHRPGHFNGVAVVVRRLFDICMPHRAYFGEKDFQQLMIIRSLVAMNKLPVEIVGCPIIREDDGLAMSSRNMRLSPEERAIAPRIYETLLMIREEAGKKPLRHVLHLAERRLNALPGMKVEYLLMANEATLLPARSWISARNLRIFVAVYLGEVRLIDNLKI
jgi:pantoate--beta-alanine ligase